MPPEMHTRYQARAQIGPDLPISVRNVHPSYGLIFQLAGRNVHGSNPFATGRVHPEIGRLCSGPRRQTITADAVLVTIAPLPTAITGNSWAPWTAATAAQANA